MSVRSWSVLGLARETLPMFLQERWYRDGRSRRGQMAVMFLVVIALIFLLAAMTMNLGEVARLRTSTANAADAGALAAAYWIASSENETAQIAKEMWRNVIITQAIMVVPFCMLVCPIAMAIWGLLALTNGALASLANTIMHSAWDNAHAAAVFTAIQNATIDDPTGTVQTGVKEPFDPNDTTIKMLSDQFEATRTLPNPVRFTWDRKGAGGALEPSWLEIDASFTHPPPRLDMRVPSMP